MEKRTRVYAAAAAAGAVTGLRSMTGPAIAAGSLASGLLTMKNPGPRWLGARSTANTLVALAVGEFIAGKVPLLPGRTTAGPLLGRFAGGGLCGAAICIANGESPWMGALVAGLAATGAALAGRELHALGTKRGKPDQAAALLEQGIAMVGGLSVIGGLQA